MKKIIAILGAVFLVLTLVACEPGEIPVIPVVPVVPAKGTFSTYFDSTVGAEYPEVISRLEGEDEKEYSFDRLLLRQIDTLVQDLVYRLTSVYGMGSSGSTDTVGVFSEKAYSLKDILNSNNNYSDKNDNRAIISDYNLIKSPDLASSMTAEYKYSTGANVDLINPDIGESASYAQTLQTGTWNSQTVIGEQYNLQNAVNGGFVYDNGFTKVLNKDESWNYSNSTGLKGSPSILDSQLVHEDFKEINNYNITMEIANILANKSSVITGETDLSEAISKIDHLGFSAADKLNITNYVLNIVIGENQVNSDDSRKYTSSTIAQSTVLSVNQHNYKAYSVVVPSIVNETLNNTFTETTKLIWTVAERNSTKIENISYLEMSHKNYTSIRITPSQLLKLTKIIIKIDGIDNINSNLTLNYSINSNIEVNILSKKSVEITSSIITIDLNSSFAIEKSIDKNGFILFEFNNKLNSNYTITFDGYYDINDPV